MTQPVSNAQQPADVTFETYVDVPQEEGSPDDSLPSPKVPVTGDCLNDAIAMVYKVMADLRKVNDDLSRGKVENAKLERKAAERQQAEALAKAKEESEKGGLFSEISDNLGLGGLAGLVSFNYTFVAADYLLHKTGLLDNLKIDLIDGAAAVLGATVAPEILVADVLIRKLDVAPDGVKATLDSFGLGESTPGISDQDVKPVMEKAIMVNLAIVAAASSIITAGGTAAIVLAIIGAALSAGGMVAQECGASNEVVLGLQIGGAAFSVSSGFFNGAQVAGAQAAGAAGAKAGAKAADASARVSTGARVASGVGTGMVTGTKGTDTVIMTAHRKAADDQTIRAQEFRNVLQRLERLLDSLIQGIKEGHESHERAAETLHGAMKTHNQTQVMASNMAMRG